MAVEDKYINADVVAGIPAKAVEFSGDDEKYVTTTFEVAAADDDDSVYRIAKLAATAVISNIVVTNDAITGGTDWDLGIYDVLNGPNSGAVKDADKLADGLDLSSARAEGSGISGLSAVPLADAQKPLYLLAGDTASDHPGQYDIAWIANTVGSAAGTVTVKIWFAQG